MIRCVKKIKKHSSILIHTYVTKVVIKLSLIDISDGSIIVCASPDCLLRYIGLLDAVCLVLHLIYSDINSKLKATKITRLREHNPSDV